MLLVVLVVEVLKGVGRGVSDASLKTGRGESAHVNNSTCDVLTVFDKEGDLMIRRGSGPDFLRARNKFLI